MGMFDDDNGGDINDIFSMFRNAARQNRYERTDGPGPDRSAPKAEPKGTLASRIIKSLIITLVLAALYFYVKLPALNIHAYEFWWFIALFVIIFTICMIVLNRFRSDRSLDYVKYVKKNLAVPFWIIIAIIAVCVIGSVVGMVIFRSRSYSKPRFASAQDSWSAIIAPSFRPMMTGVRP